MRGAQRPAGRPVPLRVTAPPLLLSACDAPAPAPAPPPPPVPAPAPKRVLAAFPDGLVVVLDAASGSTLRSVRTRAREWTLPCTFEGGSVMEQRSLPVAFLGEDVLVVEEESLVAYDAAGERRTLVERLGIGEAPFLAAGGQLSTVIVGGTHGQVVTFSAGDWTKPTAAAPWNRTGALALFAHGDAVLLGGQAEQLLLLDLPGLQPRSVCGGALGIFPILGIATSLDGSRIAVSHGRGMAVKTFLRNPGSPWGFDGLVGAVGVGRACRALSWSRDGSRLALGTEEGEVQVVAGSVPEGASDLALPVESRWTAGSSPLRLVHFLEYAERLLTVDDAGVLRIVRWRTGAVEETRALR